MCVVKLWQSPKFVRCSTSGFSNGSVLAYLDSKGSNKAHVLSLGIIISKFSVTHRSLSRIRDRYVATTKKKRDKIQQETFTYHKQTVDAHLCTNQPSNEQHVDDFYFFSIFFETIFPVEWITAPSMKESIVLNKFFYYRAMHLTQSRITEIKKPLKENEAGWILSCLFSV